MNAFDFLKWFFEQWGTWVFVFLIIWALNK